MGSIDDHSHLENGPNEGVSHAPIGPNGHPHQSAEMPSPNDTNGASDYVESESVETMLKADAHSEPSESAAHSSSHSVHESNDTSPDVADATARAAGSEVAADLDETQTQVAEDENTDPDLTTSQVTYKTRPLQANDSVATIPDTNGQENTSPYASTVIEGSPSPDATHEEATLPAEFSPTQIRKELPELPTASTSTTVSNIPKSDSKVPSANRLSISYAAGTRRMVIDANIVEKLLVRRSDGRVEVQLSVARSETSIKGIMVSISILICRYILLMFLQVEAFSEGSSSYTPLDISSPNLNDATVPPFITSALPMKTTLVGYLDKDRPLSEPKWVRTGDVQEWLRSMFGGRFWAAGDAASDGWEKKIEVVDPDPVRRLKKARLLRAEALTSCSQAPTIWTVLESWAGANTERQRFLRTHMSETDNILEILLRLVRGERASVSQNTGVTAPNVSGPLLSALSQGSAHGGQQTHVSLAVLAIFRLAVEYAKKAVGDNGKNEVAERVGEIIRFLPMHLLHKSLDGIFREWKTDKKGGR